MEGWWVISPYFARENKSEKCHQLLGLFIYHVCDEEKKSDKAEKTTLLTYIQKDGKLFQLNKAKNITECFIFTFIQNVSNVKTRKHL